MPESFLKRSDRSIHRALPMHAAALTVCLLLLFPMSSSSQDMAPMRLAAFEYPPFYSEVNGTLQGIAVELVDELSHRLAIPTELKIYPLKRALMNLEQGLSDGILILIKTPEREAYLLYTDPVMTVRGLIWSAADRKGGPVEFEHLEDLKPYKAGITIGYSYGREFDRILSFMTVEKAPTDLSNYRKLLKHRIDIFPGNEIVARGLFKQHPELQGRLNHSDKSFIEWPLHMAISRQSGFASRVPDINRILTDLREEGVIDRIVRNHTQ